MAEQSHTLGPSSPTVQEPVKHREAEDEEQPLLGSVEDVKFALLVRSETSVALCW